jgi:putative inorganic carbon (hco3(-)) transporter
MLSMLGLLIFFLPLALSSSNSVEPDTLSSSLSFVLLLVFSALWIMLKGLSLEKLRPIKYPLFCFAFFLTLSSVFSIKQSQNLDELFKYAMGFILFLLIAPLSEDGKKKLVPEIVLTALVISFLAIYQYFFGFQVLMDYLKETKIADPFVLEKITERRVFFPFPTPAILGGYLAMILPLALSPKKKILFLLPLALALLLTRSLGALLSLGSVFTIFFLMQPHSRLKKSLVLLAFAAILGGMFFLRTASPRESLLPFFSMSSRLHYWEETWEIIRTHPVTGVGFGNFDLLGSRYTHNSFLQLWAEAGIVNIVSFLWLITIILKNSWRSPERRLKAGLFAGVCVFLVHNLMDFSLFLPAVGYIWWIMLGLLYSPTFQGEKNLPPGMPTKI